MAFRHVIDLPSTNVSEAVERNEADGPFSTACPQLTLLSIYAIQQGWCGHFSGIVFKARC